MPTKQPNTKFSETEWSYPFQAENATSRGKTLHIQANPDQLKAIAKRLDVKEVKSVEADLTLTLQNGGHILYINGNFKADVIQECVVTNEPLESFVQDDIEAWYADHDKAIPFARAQQKIKAIEEGDEVQMLDEKDDPESMVDGQVDLGEMVIQFLSLAINPYPRKDGNYENIEGGEDSSQSPQQQATQQATLRPNPFAALKNWRPKD